MGADRGLLCIANNEHGNLLPWSVGRWLCRMFDIQYLLSIINRPLQKQFFNLITQTQLTFSHEVDYFLRSSASLMMRSNLSHTHTLSIEGTKLGYQSLHSLSLLFKKRDCALKPNPHHDTRRACYRFHRSFYVYRYPPNS